MAIKFNIIIKKILKKLNAIIVDIKVNLITLIFANKLGFFTKKINVGAQNINGSILKIFEKIMINFFALK